MTAYARDMDVMHQHRWFVLLLTFSLACAGEIIAADSNPKGTALPDVTFSKSRGYCDSPLSLELQSPVPGSTLRYTLDGSPPTASSGMEYLSPIAIKTTTIVRAAAFKQGAPVSRVTTHSYLLMDSVLKQPDAPSGLPSGPRAWSGTPSAYRMDQRVVRDPLYQSRMDEALLSLPVVSLVCAFEDMFGPRGLYMNPMQRGAEWERPCSLEMVLTNGETAFQVDCGVQIHGNMNRVPEKSPKHAFRILFKSKYGPGKLKYQVFPDSPVKSFNTLVLRADFNNSWIHWDAGQRDRAQRIRDAWMKDSARAMGWPAPHNRYVHLFLNGLYWGIYDFTERPDATFAEAYLGGDKDEYDVINEFEAKDGTLDEFNKLMSFKNLSTPQHYHGLKQRLDITNYIDYLLLNYYAGNQDWGEDKNWYAIRRREAGALFQYVMWDGENVLGDLGDNTVAEPYETPFALAEALKRNAEFRSAFSDRVNLHCRNAGALTPSACSARWRARAAEVDLAIIAESARWGYYRAKEPFTRDIHYKAEQRRLFSFYFPQRTAVVLDQLIKAGLYQPPAK